jgi:hypothetical protein
LPRAGQHHTPAAAAQPAAAWCGQGCRATSSVRCQHACARVLSVAWPRLQRLQVLFGCRLVLMMVRCLFHLTSKWSPAAARCIGLLPTSPMAFTSPPEFTNSCRISTWPLSAAQCMAMSCAGVRLRAEAPWSSSCSTPAAQPARTAHSLHKDRAAARHDGHR